MLPGMDTDPARLAHDLQTIMRISRSMGSERNLDRLLDLIVAAVTDLVAADRSRLFVVDRERAELWTRISQGAAPIRMPLGSGIAGVVAANASTVNIADAYHDERFNPDNDLRSGYTTRSILCMPLTDHEGAVVGVIQALNKRSGEPFSDYDEQVLGALCGSAAVAISNAQLVLRDLERQRLARDMELARQIQLGLLPAAPPQHQHWRIATYYQSCDRTGGDYFDFIPVRGGGLDAVIGDVSGHGIAAALLMSTARAFLRALHEQIDEPGEIITRLNRLLEEDMHDDGFMSLVLCRLADDGHVSYVSAGHEPPLIYHLADGFAPDSESSGIPLGMMDDARYGASCVMRPLVKGDLLLLFTDGIFEAQCEGEYCPWGMDPLREVIAAKAPEGASAVCAGVINTLKQHLAGRPPLDDLTLIVVERL